jgi:hypothetical protein
VLVVRFRRLEEFAGDVGDTWARDVDDVRDDDVRAADPNRRPVGDLLRRQLASGCRVGWSRFTRRTAQAVGIGDPRR